MSAPGAADAQAPCVYTVGHGNRPLAELLDVLKGAAIGRLIDVRAHPGSRRHPHFGREVLAAALLAHAIRYSWEGEALGGRRRVRADSPHTALRNDAFRGYADHMNSTVFREAIARVLAGAGAERIAIMCAERLPWQCHRYLIADCLVAHGACVLHVIGREAPRRHALHPAARVVDGRIAYDRHTQDPA